MSINILRTSKSHSTEMDRSYLKVSTSKEKKWILGPMDPHGSWRILMVPDGSSWFLTESHGSWRIQDPFFPPWSTCSEFKQSYLILTNPSDYIERSNPDWLLPRIWRFLYIHYLFCFLCWFISTSCTPEQMST
jgi:hypothetical protein